MDERTMANDWHEGHGRQDGHDGPEAGERPADRPWAALPADRPWAALPADRPRAALPAALCAAWPRAWFKPLLLALVCFALLVPAVGCHFMPFLARPTVAGKAKLPTGRVDGGATGVAGVSSGLPGGGGILTPGQDGASGLITPNLDPNAVPVPGLPTTSNSQAQQPIILAGRLQNPTGSGRTTQALPADVIKFATVTILDAGNKAVASTLTREDGGFTIRLDNWIPMDQGFYVVEAAKALGGPGGESARFRTIVQYMKTQQGWLSVTSSTVADPVINALTTAVAIECALDSGINKALAIGKVDVSGATPKIRAGSPLLGSHPDKEVTDLAADILAYLQGDLDPVASVPAIKPSITGLEPTSGHPGTLVKIRGTGFSPVLGGNTISFGGATATGVYLVTPTMIVVAVPHGGSSGNVTVATTRGGTSNGLAFTVTGGLQVNIQTNGIEAPFYVAGAEMTAQRGNRTVTLYPGDAQIVFTTGQAATFVVGQDGMVDASAANGALTGGSGLVSFVVTNLTVRPGSYQGTYNLSGGFMPASVIGDSSVKVLKGLSNYQMVAGSPHLFDIGADNVVHPSGSWADDNKVAQLVFSNITLSVEAQNYAGTWSISGVTPSSQTGTVGVAIPKDSRGYVFNVMGTSFTFEIDDLGGVVTNNSPYAIGSSQKITLNMVTVNVDSKGYRGQYSITGISGWVSGNQDLVMLKGLTYRITFWPGNSYVAFDLSSSGAITLQSAGGQASTAALTVPAAAKIAFNTKRVDVASNQWQGNWGILYGQKAGSWTWLMTDTDKPNWVRGDDSYTMLLGMTNYYFLYFYPGTVDQYINFNLKTDFTMQEIGRGAKVGTGVVSYSSAKISFNTIEVPVQTNKFLGNWGLYYGDSPARGWTWLPNTLGETGWISGDRRFYLLAGMADYYFLQFWPGNSLYYLPFDMNGSGTITAKPYSGSPVSAAAVTIGASTIGFSTVDVESDVKGWRGSYGLLYGESATRGWGYLRTTELDPGWVATNKTWSLIRGIQNYYFVYLYPGTVDYHINLNLGANDTFVSVSKGAFMSTDSFTFSSRKFTFNTQAFTVETGGFQGQWGIYYGDGPQRGWTWLPNDLNQTGWITGDRSVTLLKGMLDYYFLQFWPGNGTHYLYASVNSSGAVSFKPTGGPVTTSVIKSPLAAGKISFNTVDVTSDANGWRGNYALWYGESPQRGWTWLRTTELDGGWVSWASGPSNPHKTWTLLRGIQNYYFLYLYPGGTDYYLGLNLGASDTFSVYDTAPLMSTSAVSFTSAKFTFNTQAVAVDTANWQGQWGVYYGDSPQRGWTWLPNDLVQSGWVTTNRSFKMLKGMSDYCFLQFWPGNNTHYLTLTASAAGALSAKTPTNGPVSTSAITFPAAGQLKFNTMPISSNTGGYQGNYAVWYGESPTRGWTWLRTSENDGSWVNTSKTWHMIKGIKNYYFFYIYPGGMDHYLHLNLDAAGALTRVDRGANVTDSVLTPVTGSLSNLTFNVAAVSTNNNGYNGLHGLLYGHSPQLGWAFLKTTVNDTSWVSTSKTWTALRGMKDYYHLYFYPGGADYALTLDLPGTGTAAFTRTARGTKVTDAVLTPTTGSLTTTLTLNTTPARSVASNGWDGNYAIMYGHSPQVGWTWLPDDDLRSTWFIGQREYRFLKGLTDYYHFYFWPGNNSYFVTMNVAGDTNGTLTTTAAGTTASTTAVTITGGTTPGINTATVALDTNGWRGNVGILYGTGPMGSWTWVPTDQKDPNWVRFNKSYVLVRGLTDYYYLAFWPGGNNYWLNFDVQGTGTTTTMAKRDTSGFNVTTSAANVTASSTAPKITLNTTAVTFKPGKYLGLWGMRYGDGTVNSYAWLQSDRETDWVRQTPQVLADRNYVVLTGMVDYFFLTLFPGRAEQNMGLNVDTSGNITKRTLGDALTTDLLTITGSPAKTATLNTQDVVVNPNGYWGNHGFQYGGAFLNYYDSGPITSGWNWLMNQAGAATWVASNDSAYNTWTLLKGTKSYYLHAFYPLSTNYYRIIDVGATGLLSFKDGDLINATTKPYTSGSSSNIVLNTATVAIKNYSFRGYWDFMYGDANKGWGSLRDTTLSAGWVQFVDRSFVILKGIDNYYALRFWPGLQFFVGLNYNAATSLFTFDAGGTGREASSGAVNLATTNTVHIRTERVKITTPGGTALPSGVTWKLQYGDGPPGNVADLQDISNSTVDQANTTTSKEWIAVPGLTNYYWIRTSDTTLGGGFSTTSGSNYAPTPTSVVVGPRTFTTSQTAAPTP